MPTYWLLTDHCRVVSSTGAADRRRAGPWANTKNLTNIDVGTVDRVDVGIERVKRRQLDALLLCDVVASPLRPFDLINF